MTPPHTKKRWIGHADLDAFYASVEQRDCPEYRDQAVVVGALPGHRGVVAAANYQARAFGIRSAMPIAEAYRRCPDAVYLRPEMAKYIRVSQEIFQTLGTLTPVVEPVSIDEAYLDLTGLERLLGPPKDIGREIKRRIFEGTGLRASVGIGPNRLIAKLASEHGKPDGLMVVHPDEVLDFLAPMPVATLRGVGRQTQKIFSRLGIETVSQLRAIPLQYLEEQLGKKPRRASAIKPSVSPPLRWYPGGVEKAFPKRQPSRRTSAIKTSCTMCCVDWPLRSPQRHAGRICRAQW